MLSVNDNYAEVVKMNTEMRESRFAAIDKKIYKTGGLYHGLGERFGLPTNEVTHLMIKTQQYWRR